MGTALWVGKPPRRPCPEELRESGDSFQESAPSLHPAATLPLKGSTTSQQHSGWGPSLSQRALGEKSRSNYSSPNFKVTASSPLPPGGRRGFFLEILKVELTAMWVAPKDEVLGTFTSQWQLCWCSVLYLFPLRVWLKASAFAVKPFSPVALLLWQIQEEVLICICSSFYLLFRSKQSFLSSLCARSEAPVFHFWKYVSL